MGKGMLLPETKLKGKSGSPGDMTPSGTGWRLTLIRGTTRVVANLAEIMTESQVNISRTVSDLTENSSVRPHSSVPLAIR
jgi:hypothetical protein